MKKYCFHPPKNIIVGTLAAILWVAVFPFWLLGERTRWCRAKFRFGTPSPAW